MESDSKDATFAEAESKCGKRAPKQLPSNLKPKFPAKRKTKSEERTALVVEDKKEPKEGEKKEHEEEINVDGASTETKETDKGSLSPMEPSGPVPLKAVRTAEKIAETGGDRTPDQKTPKFGAGRRKDQKPRWDVGAGGVNWRAPESATRKGHQSAPQSAPQSEASPKGKPAQAPAPGQATGNEVKSVYAFPSQQPPKVPQLPTPLSPLPPPPAPPHIVPPRPNELKPSSQNQQQAPMSRSRKPSTLLRASKSGENLSKPDEKKGLFKRIFRKSFWLSSKAAEATANPTAEMIAKTCVAPEYGINGLDYMPDLTSRTLACMHKEDRVLLEKNPWNHGNMFPHCRPFWLDKSQIDKGELLPKTKIMTYKTLKQAVAGDKNAVWPKQPRRTGPIDPLCSAAALAKVNEQQATSKWFDTNRIVSNTFHGTIMFETSKLAAKADNNNNKVPTPKKAEARTEPREKHISFKYTDEKGGTFMLRDPPTNVMTQLYAYDRKGRSAALTCRNKARSGQIFHRFEHKVEAKKAVKKSNSSTSLTTSSSCENNKK